MNHRVAVHARTATSILGGIRSDETALVARRYWAIWGVAVMRTVVALRAHERRTRLQQGRNIGPVRCMATRAIFRNRLMLPEEWPALFRVAGKTGLVQGVLFQHLRSGRTM